MPTETIALAVIVTLAIITIAINVYQFIQEDSFHQDALKLTKEEFINKHKANIAEYELIIYWNHVQQELEFDNGYEDDNH